MKTVWKLRRIKIKTRRPKGDRPVTHTVVAYVWRHLAVHPEFNGGDIKDFYHPSADKYVITHVPTGYRMFLAFKEAYSKASTAMKVAAFLDDNAKEALNFKTARAFSKARQRMIVRTLASAVVEHKLCEVPADVKAKLTRILANVPGKP